MRQACGRRDAHPCPIRRSDLNSSPAALAAALPKQRCSPSGRTPAGHRTGNAARATRTCPISPLQAIVYSGAMRRILPACMLSFGLTLSGAASAQVTTDEHALDSLQAAPKPAPAPAPPAPAPAASAPATHPTSGAKPRRPARPRGPAPSPPRKLPVPVMPATPPPNPVILPPPFVMPAHPPPPPPTIPVKPDAVGGAVPIPGGTRITFGPGSADLNPATLAALRIVAAEAVANPAMIMSITAWAPGTADDPSTPRRLSLDRALAARAALINAGVVSERIRAVAKGMTDIGTAVPDRLDLLEILPAKK
jgi:outer membrane protein OmpA-like peptidoglycan-associated protein